eukprot:CAMPEP_0171055158 /NCGR_PEP_ID=MMETSP0736-20130129/55609_1 /TAXON_ID=186038 /ORGANISM="Fragilariopsis kerguelensis, Strain L26-C5" /LENGTH=447 /DNA_ID=CAMNT_0011509627 /DNA_START=129 /DNA_END=1473 /DNA_ORIENTATION=-
MVYQIVIAGAGIIGNSIAYYLAKNYAAGEVDFSITLIDPVGICPAASSKAGGFLAKKWRDKMPEEQLTKVGFDLHEELARLDFVEGYSIDPTNNLTMNTVTDYRHLRVSAAMVAGGSIFDNGDTVSHASKKIQGAQTLEWVDDSVLLGSQSLGKEKHIAQVHPKKLCERMWKFTSSSKENNITAAQLRIGTVVEAIVEREGRSKTPKITGVRLDDGTIVEADVVVAALGPWSEEIRHWFAPQEDMILEAMATNHPSTARKVIRCLEVYPRPDGDSYITGKDSTKEAMTERPGQEAVEPELIEALLDSMRQMSPEVLGAPNIPAPHTTQACYWADVVDGTPIIGPLPNVDGFFIATGHSVWGILQGPATGKAMAELLMEGKARSVDLSPYAIGYSRLSNLLVTVLNLAENQLPDYIDLYKAMYGVQQDVDDDESETTTKGKRSSAQEL